MGKLCEGCAKKQKPAPTKANRSWEQDKMYDGLDLPDEDFDDDEFVAKEFGHLPHKKIGVNWYWWLLGVIILTLMVASLASAIGSILMEAKQ